MATCHKCGNKKPKRVEAGVFFCPHCGFLPGPKRLDRFGNYTPPKKQEAKA